MNGGGKGEFLFSPSVAGEGKLLRDFLRILRGYDAVVTWKGRGFDIPFILARALRHGLPVDVLMRAVHIDVADVADRWLRLGKKDLAGVCRYFGIPKNVGLSGMDMPSLYLRALEGDKTATRQIKAHCLDDLKSLRQVYGKLKPLIALDYPNL